MGAFAPEVLESLARVLSYPDAGLPRAARDAAAALGRCDGAAAGRMARFAAFCEEAGIAAAEELYTATFDLRPACSPYVGLHLMGEGRARIALLVRLRALAREAGCAGAGELPDHVCEVLRYLARAGPDGEVVARDALGPAAARMMALLERDGNPYADALAPVAALAGTGVGDAGRNRDEVTP